MFVNCKLYGIAMQVVGMWFCSLKFNASASLTITLTSLIYHLFVEFVLLTSD